MAIFRPRARSLEPFIDQQSFPLPAAIGTETGKIVNAKA